jgi:VanZ family protein
VSANKPLHINLVEENDSTSGAEPAQKAPPYSFAPAPSKMWEICLALGRMFTLKDNVRSPTLNAARAAAWILAIAIVVLSVVPRGLRPQTDLPHYLEHFLIFFLTGIAFGLGYGRKLGLLAILLFLFAGVVEMAQLFEPGRHARISDFVIDTLALWVGLIVVLLGNEFWGHFKNSNSRT